MLFGRLSREQRDEWRWSLLHRFHGLVLSVAEGMSFSEKDARMMTTGEGKGKKGEGQGKRKEGGKGKSEGDLA